MKYIIHNVIKHQNKHDSLMLAECIYGQDLQQIKTKLIRASINILPK